MIPPRFRHMMKSLLRQALNFWICVYLTTAVLGGVVVWIVGHRGIYLYDQAGVFDGAWRLLQGQTLYRDFYTPYGPVVFWIQSVFFRLAGVDFSSMVLAAAVINSVAVVCVIWLVRRLFPEPLHRPTAAAAGLLTAVWFQAPFGTLWFEQTGFCFNLIAMVLLIETMFRGDRTARQLRVAAGCSLALSILSKQTAGIILLPVPLGVAVLTALPTRRKTIASLLHVSAGVLIVCLIFVVWLLGFSSLNGFWQSVVVMSRVLSQSRTAQVTSLLSLIMLGRTLPAVRVALAAFVVFAISGRLFSRKSNVLATWILLSYVFLQNLFASVTLNEVSDSLGYLGLINGLAFGLFSQVFWKKKAAGEWPVWYWAKSAVPILAAVFLFYRPGVTGWEVSSARLVQQFDANTKFTERLRIRGASRVIWGEPTILDNVTISRQDFEDVNAWLAKADTNFFVFPYSTLLYGLHKRVSPQPWLYMMPNHSFQLSDVGQVGTTIVQSLKRNNVTAVVLEKSSSTDDLLRQMPDLQNWLLNEFQKTKEFGYYEVWTLRGN
jgi:4-amino-4-deoxy-L-arabinose transferase-like glycosyltransferase